MAVDVRFGGRSHIYIYNIYIIYIKLPSNGSLVQVEKEQHFPMVLDNDLLYN